MLFPPAMMLTVAASPTLPLDRPSDGPDPPPSCDTPAPERYSPACGVPHASMRSCETVRQHEPHWRSCPAHHSML